MDTPPNVPQKVSLGHFTQTCTHPEILGLKVGPRTEFTRGLLRGPKSTPNRSGVPGGYFLLKNGVFGLEMVQIGGFAKNGEGKPTVEWKL